MPRKRSTKVLQDEAVRLDLTTGRGRREVADSLKVRLSSLQH
ncbi:MULTISPECIES: hypothetical protein [Microvirga]|nr:MULTISPECIES: hypothetical protein [Microvirga]